MTAAERGAAAGRARARPGVPLLAAAGTRLCAALLVATAASAQSPLDAVADALGGRGRIDALETAVVSSRVDAPRDGRDRALRSTMTLRFPGDARWDVRVRGRERAVVLTRAGAFAVLDGQAQALDPAAALAVVADGWLHPLVLARRRGEVVATEVAPGLIRVAVDGLEDDVLVDLDPSGRPSVLTTQRRRGGRVDYVSVRFSDYRAADGVMIPYRVTQTVAGTKTGTLAVDRVEVDGEVPAALFTVPTEPDE